MVECDVMPMCPNPLPPDPNNGTCCPACPTGKYATVRTLLYYTFKYIYMCMRGYHLYKINVQRPLLCSLCTVESSQTWEPGTMLPWSRKEPALDTYWIVKFCRRKFLYNKCHLKIFSQLEQVIAEFLKIFVNIMLDPCLSKECPRWKFFQYVSGNWGWILWVIMWARKWWLWKPTELLNLTCAQASHPPLVSCRGNSNNT